MPPATQLCLRFCRTLPAWLCAEPRRHGAFLNLPAYLHTVRAAVRFCVLVRDSAHACLCADFLYISCRYICRRFVRSATVLRTHRFLRFYAVLLCEHYNFLPSGATFSFIYYVSWFRQFYQTTLVSSSGLPYLYYLPLYGLPAWVSLTYNIPARSVFYRHQTYLSSCYRYYYHGFCIILVSSITTTLLDTYRHTCSAT